AALLAVLLAPAPALADDPVFDRAFGAGPADLCTTVCRPGSNGGGAGELSFPYGAAVSAGEVYVVGGNHRVSVYGTDGRFRRAFGKNVNASSGNPDVCTISSGCRAGAAGGAAGQLNNPYDVAVSGGEVYVADASNNRISVFSTMGTFLRAFGKGVNGGPGDPDLCTAATSCRAGISGGGAGELSFPLGIAVSGGEVYAAEAGNNRISVYTTAGAYVRTFGAPGSEAGQLSFPFALTVSGGEVYVADQNNQRVSVFATNGTFARAFGRSVNPTVGNPDVCTTLTTCRAGTAGGAAGSLKTPLGVAVSGGELYVSDANHRVSVFGTDGVFARAFGKDVNPTAGDPNLCTTITTCQSGIAGGAAGQLNSPAGVAVDGGEVFVADTSNYRVGVFSTAGTFSRAFGKSVWPASPFVCTTATGCGPGAGGGSAAQLNLPFGVTVAGGEAYVADQANHRVSVYSADGAFSRAFGGNVNAGAGSPGICTNTTTCRSGTGGTGAGQLSSPAAVAVSGGEVFVADESNHRISVFATDGTFVRAFGKDVNAGTGIPDICTSATTCRSGSLGGEAGQLDNPVSVAISGGEVFVTDQGNRRISVFTTAGAFVRAFGKDVNPSTGDPDVCTPTTACRSASIGAGAGQLNTPYGLAVGGGEVYVADYFNHRVSVFTTAGAFARAFGKGVNGGAGTPDVCTTATTCRAGSIGGAAGVLSFPFGVGLGDGAVYVTERFNARVSVLGTDGGFARAFGRMVNPAPTGNPDVCTAATTCRAAAQGDTAAQFMEPMGVGVSGTKIYVADRLNHRIAVYRVPRTEISRDPATLGFGKQDIGAGPTAAQSSTITNTGTETVTLSALTLAGDSGQFTRLTGASGDCAATLVLEPGQTCAVRLRFDPTTAGAKTAELTVTSNAPAITVALTGTGVQTQLSRSPAALAFGPRDVDDGPAGDQATTLTNAGTETVVLSGLALTGDSTQFTRLAGLPGDCGATTQLTAGQTCSLRFRFDPTTTGAKAATLTVTSNAATLTVALSGSGTQTQLAVAPATLAFGSRDVDNGPAADQSSTVTNTGTEPVTLSGVALTGDSTQFTRLTGAPGDCAATTQLAAGQTCSLRVRFDPSTTGPKAATVTVTSSAPTVTVALSGRGSRTRLTATPATLAFGSRDVAGGSGTLSSTLTNSGSETIAFSGVALTGDTSEFTRLTGEAGDCTAATQLDPGQSCVVRARFDPTSTGAKTATISITSTAPALSLALTGSGMHLELTRAPAALAFGQRDLDTGPTATQVSTLTNTGTEAVTISGLTFAGDGSQFARVSDAPGDCTIAKRLEDGQSCALRLRFDPSSIGAKAATLTVTSNAPPQVVALTGSGIQTELSSDPPALGFGSLDIDDKATAQSATIANTGSEPVTVTALILSGDTAPYARLAGAPGDCAATTQLDAGETCTVRIRFDPATTGPKSASLTVTSDAPALVVPLGGTGTTTQTDADGDGTPDASDSDDDNDGVDDAVDAFPRDAAESLDSDGDGAGNNADPDDDNDGVPDDRDAFPLDPTRHSAASPPPPPPPPVEPAGQTVFDPWRLKRLGPPRVTVRRDGTFVVGSGYAALCPK
ncbi:MAG: choice-of-anchor D domain-containing protein, partial [Actinomycetota bacterium]|nr:choice-of-anchor D domain-containing protein [Actinomycetota bacterium]